MGTLLVELVVAVISFGMVFTEFEMFLAQGPAFFIAVVFTLFCAIVLTLFHIGILVRYLFCAATHVGVGPSIIFLPFVLMKQNGRIRWKPLCTWRALTKPVIPYRVLQAYLSGEREVLQRYRWGILIQLVGKCVVCAFICVFGIVYRNAMVVIFGLDMLCFFIDLSAVDDVDAVGEWTLFHNTREIHSEFSDRFFASQMVLYLMEDPTLLEDFVQNRWERIKGCEDRERLADILYYIYLAGLADQSLVIPQSFTDDVQDLLFDWTQGMVAATYQWWFLLLYLVWSHNCDTEDSRNLIVWALQRELESTNLPTRWLQKKRAGMLEFIIAVGETGNAVGESKHKYKILYKNYYCHIAPTYSEAYRQVCNKYL